MKKTLLCVWMLCLFCVSLSVQADNKEKFIIDNQHSYVLWRIDHLGFSKQAGKWYANGFIILDKKNPQNSQVEVTIEVADIITGNPELDKHLKGKLFFDVAQFPKATFKSNRIELLGDKSAKIYGKLDLHGVKKPVVLMAKLTKSGKNPISDKTTIGFSATTKIKRSDFGMKTLLPNLGDEVDIDIGVEAYRAKSEG